MGWGGVGEWVVGGGRNKNNKKALKSSNFHENVGFPSFPENILFWGSFFKMYFRRRPPDRQPLAFGGNPRTHLEVQGPLGDEVTYPRMSKILKIKDSTI